MKGSASLWLTLAMLIALGVGAREYGPQAWQAFRLLRAQDDPDALASIRLGETMDAPRLADALGKALEEGDIDLAVSYATLAEQLALPLPEHLRSNLTEAQRLGPAARRQAGEFLQGAVSGKAESDAAMVGAIAADLSGLGDIRDLALEARKFQQGEEPDQLVIGLALVGLTVTGATILSMGSAAPARVGVSTVKVAARSGRLSRPLLAAATRISREAVDTDQLRLVLQGARALDLPAAKAAASAALRPGAAAQLTRLAGDTATIGTKAGSRAALEALSIGRNSDDLARIASLSAKRGSATRAILKTLGLGAIALTGSILTLAGWAMTGLIWAFAALLLIARLLKGAASMVAAVVPPYRQNSAPNRAAELGE